MHFSDRTVVVCMLLWCASRLQGWILSRGFKTRGYYKARYLVYFELVDSVPCLYFPILQEDEI